MIISELFDFKITMSDFGKVTVLHHVHSARHSIQNLEPEQVIVIDAQKLGHQKQLTEYVAQIKNFAEYVKNDEVVAESFARPKQ